jgi:hypothetical protein
MRRRILLIVIFLIFEVSLVKGENILKSTIKNQRFLPDEIHLKADTQAVFQITNEDKIPVEFESTDLNKEKMVLPGKTLEIPLKGLKPGVYEFFSDFGPKELRGRIIVE